MTFNHNLFPFKRRYTEFKGGECPRHASDLMGRTDYYVEQPVQIVKCVNEDEDLWELIGGGNNTFYAYGDDMHPHPCDPETNVEAITRLMENGSTALVQMFIVEAVTRYAREVLADEAETLRQMEGGMVNGQAWINTAKEVKDFYDQQMKK